MHTVNILLHQERRKNSDLWTEYAINTLLHSSTTSHIAF